jgi:hypothetical protein
MTNISANFTPFYQQVCQDASGAARVGIYASLCSITMLAMAILLDNPSRPTSTKAKSTFSEKLVAFTSLTGFMIGGGAVLGALSAVIYNIANLLLQSKRSLI